MVRVTGFEPAWINRQILSLVRLPVPPHPHGKGTPERVPIVSIIRDLPGSVKSCRREKGIKKTGESCDPPVMDKMVIHPRLELGTP